jgi:hypothetical protein
MTQETFAQHAPALRRAGWAVLPSEGKSPLRKGFNKWRYPPGEKTVEQWARRAPDADIVIVAGLCETGKGHRGVIVVDCDDETAVSRASELFGETPGRVRTRRGEHRYFRADGADLGTLSSLRAYGLEIDLKHGQHGAAIVAAPPSPHEKDRGFCYTWEHCGPDVLKALPPFRAAGLSAFLEKQKPTETAKPAFLGKERSRRLWLNRQLAKHAGFFDGEDAELLNSVLDKARQFNQSLAELGIEPLDDKEVMRVSRQIAKDVQNGKLVRCLGRRATSISDADETRLLGSHQNGPDAFIMLQLFRQEHEARCKRGETFAICIKAMVESGVLAAWGRYRYRQARDLLLQWGFIREVSPAQFRKAAQYELVPRVQTPSLATAPHAGTAPEGLPLRRAGRQESSIGANPCAPVSVSRAKPWAAAGVSKSTYYRRKKAKAAALADQQQHHYRAVPRVQKCARTTERKAACAKSRGAVMEGVSHALH